MSNIVHVICQKRIVGSPTVKAVLMYMSDRASDDGSGIWTSKTTMAADLEMSKRTVQNAILQLQERGLILQVGSRKCERGFTVDYRINLEAIERLESTIERDRVRGAGDAPVQEMHPYGCSTFTPTGAGDAPKPSLEPSLEPSSACDDLFNAIEPTEAKKPTDRFEDFWKVYPKKAGKPAAQKAFQKAIKGGADPDAIITGAKRYALCEAVQKGFIKHPQGWLTDQRWNDADLPELPDDARRYPVGSPEDIAQRRDRLLNRGFGEVVR